MDTLQLTNFVWSIALFLGCWGLGNPLAKKIKAPGWAAAPIGMAIIILVAGWLDMAHLANRMAMTLIALAAIGTGLVQFRDIIAGIKSIGKSPAWVALIPAVIIAWLGAQANILSMNWDDANGYVPVCHELSANGSSWAPFSLRRALSWGGQFPLQNLGMLFTADYGAYVYERCLANWMWVIIAICVGKKTGGIQGIFLALILPILPHTNVNSAPHATVALLLLTAWMLRATPIMFAALGAAAMAMRFQAIPVIGLMALWTLWEHSRDLIIWRIKRPKTSVRLSTKPTINWVWKSACALLVLLSPFVINHIHQFQTPLPMFWPGTIEPKHLSWETDWKTQIQNLHISIISQTWVILSLIWAAVTFKECRGVAITTLVTYLYVVLAMPEYSSGEWSRYCWPIFIASATAIFLVSKKDKWMTTVFLIALTIPVTQNWRRTIAKELKINTPDIQAVDSHFFDKVRAFAKSQGDPLGNTLPTKDSVFIDRLKLLDVQQELPEGAKIAIIATQCNRLNFSRNKIFNMDEFGAVGHMPTDSSLENLKAWAKKNDIQFLIFNDFDGFVGGNLLKKIYLTPEDPRSDLKHYRRVWYPIRGAVIHSLTNIAKKEKPPRKYGFFTLDLRSEK
jgi:hypothetical protein